MSAAVVRVDDEESQQQAHPILDCAPMEHDSADGNNSETAAIDRDVMIEALRKEISLASEDWRELTALRDRFKKKPAVVRCVTTLQQVVPATCFDQFYVVLAHSILTVNPNPTRRSSGALNEECSSSNQADADTVELAFHTMHFVHRTKPDVGYEVQSVWMPGSPMRLQCYPRLNLQYLLMHVMRLQYGTPPCAANKYDWDASRLVVPQHGNVVILGMGGNVMANCLVHLLPPTVPIHVVEIEPSVVAVCQLEQLIPTTPNFHVHICDVVVALARLQDASCSMIILDCFDPLEGDMLARAHWLQQVKRKLIAATGVVVVNMHCAANVKFLSVFVEVFGRGCVEVLEFGSHPAQVAIVCSAGPVAELTKDQLNRLARAMLHTEGLRPHADDLCFPTDTFVVGYKSVKFPMSTHPSSSTVAVGDEEASAVSAAEHFNVRVWKCGAV